MNQQEFVDKLIEARDQVEEAKRTIADLIGDAVVGPMKEYAERQKWLDQESEKQLQFKLELEKQSQLTNLCTGDYHVIKPLGGGTFECIYCGESFERM